VRGESDSPDSNGARPPASVDNRSPEKPSADLPVFGWLQSVKQAPSGEDGDWTRELVEAEEAPSDEDRGT